MPGSGEVLRISSDGDDRMEAKSKPQKNSLGLPAKPIRIPGSKISLKNFQKAIQVRLYFIRRTTRPDTRSLPRIFRFFSPPPPPKKSRNRKFQTQKIPSIIPVTRSPSNDDLLRNWATWDSSDSVWKVVKSFFRRRFHGRLHIYVVGS